jgi:hypothetical protein
MASKICAAATAAVLALGLAGGAQAATVTLHDSSTDGVGNMAHLFAGGYNAYTPTGASWSSDPTVTPPPGSVSAVYKSPFSNTPLADTQSYFAVGAESGANGALSPVRLTFDSAQSAFTMLWGSIDSFNTITFFSGASNVYSLTGTALVALLGLPGTPKTFDQVALVTFSDFGPTGFDSIQFRSTLPSFEFALLAPVAPIPVPAAGLLLLSALGGIALIRRTRSA